MMKTLKKTSLIDFWWVYEQALGIDFCCHMIRTPVAKLDATLWVTDKIARLDKVSSRCGIFRG